jgi:hypothetical protein
MAAAVVMAEGLAEDLVEEEREVGGIRQRAPTFPGKTVTNAQGKDDRRRQKNRTNIESCEKQDVGIQ